MRTGLGCAQHIAGHDAEDQGCGDGKQQGRADGDADLRQGGRRAVLLVGTLRGRKGQAQVVGRGHAGIEQADDGQPDRSSANRRRERIELAEESAGEGNADQRDQEEDEQAAEQRRAVEQAAEVADEGQLLRRIRWPA